ncbi:MAG TPA: hypothetical protein VG102_02850, partial [Candidatus Paceibacterota bacterium]|nr:hypothetical protein [Candidatus Paceibacterota bacterium]
MNKAKLSNILLAVFLLAFAPTLAFAQQTPAASDATSGGASGAALGGLTGIFSCNQQGAYAMSVGALGATGGVYVPVADATVELNTGTLVYKECILREVVDAQRRTATAGLTQNATNNILNGRNGSPLFVQYQTQEITQVKTAAIQTFLQNGGSSLDPKVKQAIAQGYAIATYNAPSMLACPYAGATTAFSNPNSQFSFS